MQNKLTQIFLDYLKDYGSSQRKNMSLRERIKLFQEQYTPIHLIVNSNPIQRSLNMSSSLNDSITLRKYSKAKNN